MKLRSLRVHGFKSFADSTVIDFHEGITAIVGPNGCGKSNISDAVRWVLGEQKASAIRGGKMEEAIFQGSLNRRPVNRGAVTMVVSNEDGALPVAFDEVEIGRTVYRDGGSDYSLNRSTCRLKDVVDLCRDTGLGANAYSVIETRMIDAILSDRAEERRQLFEEASGIGKYKDRRKAALRRLEHADADLTRLEDVIAEVETKVRSLARQKGKAERYKSLRERRLSVEVSVVRNDLADLRGRLKELDGVLEGRRKTGQGMVAELRAAEATYEILRLEEVTAERARIEAATALEQVKAQLVEWERDLAVAGERRGYAKRRLGQIGTDREAWSKRLGDVRTESAELQVIHDGQEGKLERAGEDTNRQVEISSEVRGRLNHARALVEEAEHRERDLVRRGAQLEGDAEAARGQAAELERRIERITAELSDASSVLNELESQGDLFTTRFDGLESAVDDARKRLEAAQEDVGGRRKALDDARLRDLDAARIIQGMEAEVAALEALGIRQEGVDPAMLAVLGLGDADVVGSLLDYIDASDEVAAAVETYLGPFAQALVVRDGECVERIVRWFADEWAGEGGLVLLPLDRMPEPAGGSLLESVKGKGEGAPWVEALLGAVDLVESHDSGNASPVRPTLSLGGVVSDPRGFVKIGRPSGTSGVLERRARVDSMRQTLSKASGKATASKQEVEDAGAAMEAAEAALAAARVTFLGAEDELRQTSAEMAAQVDQRARVDTHRDELARQLEGAKAARARALERAQTAGEDREGLLGQEGAIRSEREQAREALVGVQDEWEAARVEESRLSVSLARMEAEAERVAERLGDLARETSVGEDRLGELDTEEKALAEELGTVEKLQEDGRVATERLFGERDAADTLLVERTTALSEVVTALAEADKAARAARSAEREAVDQRHQFELERQEVSSRIGLIQERLEGEWGRPLERLLEEAEPVEGDPEGLKEELEELVVHLERIGLVNMLAVEEYAEESTRLEFLTEQREDLTAARNDLKSAIREINETAIDLFEGTFEKIRENFQSTFQRLFEGGEADMWLADPEDPLESPIEVHASPRGKKTQRIDLLSGGERALTALSLLFGIYLVKPSPFCVLDEVDAPLDENNIGRFIHLLQEFKEQTQFVIITHNPRSIEAADWIYGVTMEEPGVSTIVGVQFQDVLEVGGSAAYSTTGDDRPGGGSPGP